MGPTYTLCAVQPVRSNTGWKTRLQLPDSEKCSLIKTPLAAPTSASAWTFTCLFRSCPAGQPTSARIDGVDYPLGSCFVGNGYEAMVKFVQSFLHLSYQPDPK